MPHSYFLVFFVCTAACSTTSVQTDPIPIQRNTTSAVTAQVEKTPKIAAELRKIGPYATPEAIKRTLELYNSIHIADKGEDLLITRDRAYGSHVLQTLDIFTPPDAEGKRVLLFVHGGGFVAGDKRNAHNIGRWAARHGMIGVTINYRLAPEAQWPSGAMDVAQAIKWIKTNIAEFGGDPTRLIIAGESAGSIHTADYIFREELQINEDGVIGAILISLPSTDLTTKAADPHRDMQYFGVEGDRRAQSVVNAVAGRQVPVLIAYAEYDPDFILDQTLRLVEAIATRDQSESGRRVPLVVSAPGHNHISISQHIGTVDETLGPDLIDFIFQLPR